MQISITKANLNCTIQMLVHRCFPVMLLWNHAAKLVYECLDLYCDLGSGAMCSPLTTSADEPCKRNTVYMVIFAVVLFLRISRVRPCENVHFNTMSICSYENIRKIAKLSSREFPHLVKNRENICTRNYIWRIQYQSACQNNTKISHV